MTIQRKGTSQFPIDPPERDYTPHTVQRPVDPSTGERPPASTFNVPKTQEGYQQLPMFMTADDLQQSITITGDGIAGTRDPETVLGIKSLNAQQKLGRGRGSGVYNAIKEEGVKNPVQLIHTDSDIMLGDGHHRTGSAIDQARSGVGANRFIPVIHTDRPEMKHAQGYSTPEIKDAIAEGHGYRDYSDEAFGSHFQFKRDQGVAGF